MPRRTVAWLIDAAIGILLAAFFIRATGGPNDARTVWHLMLFKSVGGAAGRQLSAAFNVGDPALAALRPVLGLLAILFVVVAVSVAYRVVTTALWGAGIGKYLLDMRIVVDPSPDGPQAAVVPGWGRSWKRWAVPQVPGLLPFPGSGLLAYLPAYRDRRRRGLHDRAAGTIVVDVRRPASGIAQRGGDDVLDRDRRLLEDKIGA